MGMGRLIGRSFWGYVCSESWWGLMFDNEGWEARRWWSSLDCFSLADIQYGRE